MTSSTITSQPRSNRSFLMLSAKLASPLNAVAKPSSALGARSCRISSIAVPSSPEPAWPGSTSTAGSSPAACDTATELMPSDRAQSFTPTPVTWNEPRAASAACALSLSLTLAACTDICFSASLRSISRALSSLDGAALRFLLSRLFFTSCVIASLPGSTRATSERPAISEIFATGTSARTVRCSEDTARICPPTARTALTRSSEYCLARMSTRVVELGVTATPVCTCGRELIVPIWVRLRASTTSALSTLDSAGVSDFLMLCSAAIWAAVRSLMDLDALTGSADAGVTAVSAARRTAVPAVTNVVPLRDRRTGLLPRTLACPGTIPLGTRPATGDPRSRRQRMVPA